MTANIVNVNERKACWPLMRPTGKIQPSSSKLELGCSVYKRADARVNGAHASGSELGSGASDPSGKTILARPDHVTSF